MSRDDRDAEVEIITPPVADETDALDHGLVTLTEAICQAYPDIESGYGLGGRFGYGENFENDVFLMRRFYWGDCDCGWMELSDQWSEKHKHSDDCYWNVSRKRIEESEFTAARERALKERGQHKWLSPEYDVAQEKVHTAYNDLRAFEQHVHRELCEQHGIPWNDGRGAAVHCTCSHDRLWAEFLKDHPGHEHTCSLELPNFLHKRTGFEVRWYKWIGRDNETRNAEGVDLQSVFAECLASLNAGQPMTAKNHPENENTNPS